MQVYFIHFFHWQTLTEGFPFVRCLEFNHKLGKPTGKYIIIISHFKDLDRRVHKKYVRKQKKGNLETGWDRRKCMKILD